MPVLHRGVSYPNRVKHKQSISEESEHTDLTNRVCSDVVWTPVRTEADLALKWIMAGLPDHLRCLEEEGWGAHMARTSSTSVGSKADAPASLFRLSPATRHAAEFLDADDP